MASSTLGLFYPDFDNLQAVAGLNLHGSFNTRLTTVFDGMIQVCGSPLYQPLCEKYKASIHTHVPSPAPLTVPANTIQLIP